MDINELRAEIDSVDSKLIGLFSNRMDLSAQIADYKQMNKMPVLDASRERQKLSDVSEQAGEKMSSYAFVLFSLLLEMSRSYQHKILNPSSELIERITSAMEETDNLFTQQAVVACQGVDGELSQLACEKLFKLPNTMFFNSWEGVFSAIDNGLCQYGVIPIENSTSGSVNKVYDLMMRYNFSIVRSIRLKSDCSLLAKKGTALSDVKEIFADEKAINQCEEFIKKLGNIKVTPCENSAVAAEMAAASPENDVAALSSRSCAELYGLCTLSRTVQDQYNNYTRFICISKKLEIYPGADRTSIMMVLPHKPGSLYKVLARFYALGINLVKLESRPIPERDFEFMFYFDLDTPIYSEEFKRLICELDDLCEEFKYLGSYTEVIL